jgi:hypothetical protein
MVYSAHLNSFTLQNVDEFFHTLPLLAMLRRQLKL